MIVSCLDVYILQSRTRVFRDDRLRAKLALGPRLREDDESFGVVTRVAGMTRVLRVP